MVAQVVLHEGGDEEVGVGVALLHAQRQRHSSSLGGIRQGLRT